MNAVVTQTLPALLLGLLGKSALLLLAAWAVCGLLRRASAAARHLVWAAALGGVLLLPLCAVSLPHWDMAWRHTAAASRLVAPTVTRTSPPSPAAPSEVSPSATLGASPLPVPTPPRDRPIHAPRNWSVIWIVSGLGVWLLGVLVILARLAVGLGRVEAIKRRAVCPDAATLALTESLRGRFGLGRPVAFLRAASGSGVAVPLTWGGRRPTVLLPEQSGDWPEGSLRAALLHELAHIARWDWTTQTLAQLACALYWVNPLVWAAARAARAESERASDDCVLGAGLTAADYAQSLVNVVRSMPDGAPARTVAIAMAQPSEVEGRLRALLVKGRDRGPLTRKLALEAVAVLAVLVLPLSALRLVAQAQAVFTAADATQPAPGGGTVRLVGISPYPSGPGTWWGKDGVRLPGPPVPKAWLSSPMFSVPAGQKAREFVVEITGHHISHDLFAYGSPTTLDFDSHQTHNGIFLDMVETLPATQKSGAVRFAAASGSWQTLGTATLTDQNGEIPLSGNAPVLGNYTMRLSPSSVTGGVLTFTWTLTGANTFTFQSPRFPIFRFVAIDARGRHIVAADRKGQSIAGAWRHTITFPTLALQDIKLLQFQTRYYDWVEFQNVPLQPTGVDKSFGLPAPSVTQAAPVSVGFRRYVSRPLPDGTRYTFLYPAYAARVNSNAGSDTNNLIPGFVDCIGTQTVHWTPVRGGEAVTYPLYSNGKTPLSDPHEEFISVVVGHAGDVPFLTSGFIRQDRQWAGKGVSHHTVLITDARTHFRFMLSHEDRNSPALFRQTDPVIADSFRVLPPPH